MLDAGISEEGRKSHRLVGRFSETDIAALILLALALAYVVLFYGYFGFTTDEDWGRRRAKTVFDYYAYGSNIEFKSINFYGSLPDLIAYIVEMSFPSIGLHARHLVGGLFGLLGAAYTYKVGKRFVSEKAGLVAFFFMLICPGWSGYMFFNLKDIPYASLVLVSYYYCMRLLINEEVGLNKILFSAAKVAISIGLLANTRAIGVVMVALFCVISLPFFTFDRLRDGKAYLSKVAVNIAWTSIASIVGALAFLTIFWPQVWVFDTPQIVRALTAFFNFDKWKGSVLINGEIYKFDEIPLYYMTEYIIIGMPLLILSSIAYGFVYSLYSVNRIVMSWVSIVLFMLMYQAVTGSKIYGGYRHFLFLFPFLMLITGYGVISFFEMIPWRMRQVAYIVVAILTACILFQHYTLFPYQYSFYNVFVGGLRGAEGRFYVDVWRSAATEALAKIDDAAKITGNEFKVFTCAPPINRYLFSGVQFVGKKKDADYIVATARGCPTLDFGSSETVWEVKRQGVVFATIRLNLESQLGRRADSASAN